MTLHIININIETRQWDSLCGQLSALDEVVILGVDKQAIYNHKHLLNSVKELSETKNVACCYLRDSWPAASTEIAMVSGYFSIASRSDVRLSGSTSPAMWRSSLHVIALCGQTVQ